MRIRLLLLYPLYSLHKFLEQYERKIDLYFANNNSYEKIGKISSDLFHTI